MNFKQLKLSMHINLHCYIYIVSINDFQSRGIIAKFSEEKSLYLFLIILFLFLDPDLYPLRSESRIFSRPGFVGQNPKYAYQAQPAHVWVEIKELSRVINNKVDQTSARTCRSYSITFLNRRNYDLKWIFFTLS